MSNILWLDLETISLNPVDPILEVGMRVTDGALQTLAQLDLVVHRHLYYKKVSILADKPVLFVDDHAVVPVVEDMHEKSGLWNEVEASPHSFEFVAQQAADFAREHFPEGKIVLAGSSTHFDRGYVKLQMPELEKQLHYRMIDVSSWTEVVKACFGFEIPKIDSKHRSIHDIEDAISRLRSCFDFLEHRGYEKGYKRGYAKLPHDEGNP